MTISLSRAGEAVAVRRRLAGRYQPLDLYAALTSGGASDTILLEGVGGRSMILARTAVRAECRGRDATLTALTANGRLALEAAVATLARHVVGRQEDVLSLHFENIDDQDAEVRLLAPSPYDAVRALVGMKSLTDDEPFTLFSAGVVAFDHVDMFETLPKQAEDPLYFPDFLFWLAESIVVIEPDGEARVLCSAFGSDDEEACKLSFNSAVERLSDLVRRCEAAPAFPITADAAPALEIDPAVDLSDEEFASVVTRLKQNIVAGDVYQIVPSRTFSTKCSTPLQAYARQRVLDPSPYMYFISAPDHILFGASPETSVKVRRQDGTPIIEVKPIAGTRRRGATADADDRMEADLRLDAKESAEHMMLVDLARNDVARVSMKGTRRVDKLLTVERYARVMHLVSSVTGKLATRFDPFHALQACLNVGTLSGAPKLRAVELLRGAEKTRRGPYGGAVGWISGSGEMDTAVIIRSAVVKEGIAYVRAGAGVVHDSIPLMEAEETRSKASAVLSALAAAEAA